MGLLYGITVWDYCMGLLYGITVWDYDVLVNVV